MQEIPLPINEDGMPVLEGIIERVIYQNEENGYTVCEMAVGEAEEITLVGTMPFLCAGETITARGDWVLHPSFGRQFKVSYYEKKLPSTTSSILKYLSCGAVKGIGPKTAKALVDAFGEDTFDVLENHPDWFAKLPGISLRRAQEISQRFKEQYGMRSVMLFCRDFFGPATSVRIYRRFGTNAIDLIKEDPYMLCEQIQSVSFRLLDADFLQSSIFNLIHICFLCRSRFEQLAESQIESVGFERLAVTFEFMNIQLFGEPCQLHTVAVLCSAQMDNLFIIRKLTRIIIFTGCSAK